MISLACQHDNLKKHGKDRKGNRRWKCCKCGCTVTKANHERPLGNMRTDLADACHVLKMLLEDVSIRAAERITGMNRDTICDLILNVGENCNRFLASTVKNMVPKFVEMDELWGFVGCKAKDAPGQTPWPGSRRFLDVASDRRRFQNDSVARCRQTG